MVLCYCQSNLDTGISIPSLFLAPLHLFFHSFHNSVKYKLNASQLASFVHITVNKYSIIESSLFLSLMLALAHAQ